MALWDIYKIRAPIHTLSDILQRYEYAQSNDVGKLRISRACLRNKVIRTEVKNKGISRIVYLQHATTSFVRKKLAHAARF